MPVADAFCWKRKEINLEKEVMEKPFYVTDEFVFFFFHRQVFNLEIGTGLREGKKDKLSGKF